MRIIGLFIGIFCFLSLTQTVVAQGLGVGGETIEASDSAQATTSADFREATSSALVRRVVEKKPNITEPEPQIKGTLERFLELNPPGPLSPFNVVSHAIRKAVVLGVPANTIVLILLFPLVATVVVIARHIIGLKSFGIFTPALLAVAFLATGLITGLTLFVIILLAATLARALLRKIRVQYLPRMAIFLWFVSMAIFSTLLLSPTIGQQELITIGIFPILILILLAETYIDAQITRTFSQAISMTGETVIVALICYGLMKLEILQFFVLVNPELFNLCLLILITVVDRYNGLRLLEIWRFRKIIWK